MMQYIKEKIIGLVLIVLGVLPFIQDFGFIKTFLEKYPSLLPGEIIFQIILIVAGVLLLIKRVRLKTTN